jgi:hypothetical protein
MMRPAWYAGDHLEFLLPHFIRVSWVSDQAQEVWAGRFQRVLEAWREVEWISVACGLRPCALLRHHPRRIDAWSLEWRAIGLAFEPLPSVECDSIEVATSPAYVAVGSPPLLRRFRRAWDGQDHEEIGALLGYPECCRQAFISRCVETESVDPTWAVAAGTDAIGDRMLRIKADASPVTNVLWRYMGIRAVLHIPCRFDCSPSIDAGHRLLAAGTQAAYRTEMEMLCEILSWPAEWSALHGIVEVKTPVLKMSSRTDATAGKYVIQWLGDRVPAEAARGLCFPYPARASSAASGGGGVPSGGQGHLYQISAETPGIDQSGRTQRSERKE